MSYQPTLGIGDAVNMALTQKPGRTAGKLAAREASKYGVSRIGDQFYTNNHFTNLGGATTGGLIGAASGLLSGDDLGKVGEKTGLGAASGYTGTALSNYAMGQGASQAAANVAGNIGGAGVGLLGNVLLNGDENLDSAAASAVGSTLGSAIASGVGLGSYAGPIGAAVGAAIGLIKNAGQKPPRLNASFQYDSPIRYSNGKWDGGRITGIDTSAIPEKYRGKFVQKANQNRDWWVDKLNNGYDNFYGGKISDKAAEQVGRYINKLATTVPRSTSQDIKDWAAKTPDKYSGTDWAAITPTIKALNDEQGFINKYGRFEWYDDGTEE